MPQSPSAEHLGGYVLCVGIPLQRVGEVARLLRGRAPVIATADVDGARMLLGPPAGGPAGAVVPPAVLDGGLDELVTDDEQAVRIVRGPLQVDLAAREVTARGDRIHLSMREFDLLAALASDTDRVWSFADLTRTVWRTVYLGDPDPVVSAVKRLRKRLHSVPELRLSSVRGVGYRLLVPA
ncbi:winged helix-turn-helix domain-containing protein [Isoptericola sp. NEAU-Y5]|uniref:Winged helix-turn-helix domain-containing protein n=1 Tax=Isoptericola luteus TaxID=2879484 RepID=A0ABS7ZGL4_9MICO|nr:winged helix-turn-helix domain-containing protein [Isoptericola sp. NEAU-Y5]MCA5894158.1 winged helix-turn-helix domain-containing protein [Isoptericola sp. NEAU-Y5]